MDLWKFENRFYLLLMGLLVTLPFFAILPSLITGLLFINMFAAPQSVRRQHKIFKGLPLLYLAYFGIYAISYFYSENKAEALQGLEIRLSYLLLPPAIALGIGTIGPEKKNKLLKAFVIAVSAAALLSLLYAVYRYFSHNGLYRYWSDGSIRDNFFFYTGLSEPIMHPGYFSVYVGSAIFIIIGIFNQFKNRWFAFTWIVFLTVFLIMLQGRMNIIAFLLVLAVYLLYIFIKNRKYKLLLAMFAAVVLLIAAVSVLPPSVKERFTQPPTFEYDLAAESVGDFTGFTIRLAEWHCAIPVIEDNFWTGTGVGDSQEELTQSYIDHNFKVGYEREFNSHNQFLETTLATGIFGLIILLAILTSFLYLSIKHKDGLLAMLTLLFFLSMLTESMLERQRAISLFCSLLLFMGLSAGIGKKAERP